MTDLTPDEVEVGRRNLIAELKDAARSEELGATHNVVLLPQTVADLIAVLEASKPVVDREALIEALAKKRCVLREDDGGDGAWDFPTYDEALQMSDAVLAALYPKATEGES